MGPAPPVRLAHKRGHGKFSENRLGVPLRLSHLRVKFKSFSKEGLVSKVRCPFFSFGEQIFTLRDFPCAGNRRPLTHYLSLPDPVIGTEIKLWRNQNGRSRIWLPHRDGFSSRAVEDWGREGRNLSGPAAPRLEGFMTRTKKPSPESIDEL